MQDDDRAVLEYLPGVHLAHVFPSQEFPAPQDTVGSAVGAADGLHVDEPTTLPLLPPNMSLVEAELGSSQHSDCAKDVAPCSTRRRRAPWSGHSCLPPPART